jgi:nitrogenase molybdenum-iron protein beta chain
VTGLTRFLLHETGLVPKEQFIVDNVPKKYQEQIEADIKSTSDKREIPVYFDSDAGAMQDVIRGLSHKGRGLIMGSGWDKELAGEIGADFLSIACPTPYRIVLTTNYVGYTGGLRVIEDIYNTSLATYK